MIKHLSLKFSVCLFSWSNVFLNFSDRKSIDFPSVPTIDFIEIGSHQLSTETTDDDGNNPKLMPHLEDREKSHLSLNTLIQLAANHAQTSHDHYDNDIMNKLE